jgi:glyoxylase-like metal-dependent hydrolase (beta-lactamase superfamily II)
MTDGCQGCWPITKMRRSIVFTLALPLKVSTEYPMIKQIAHNIYRVRIPLSVPMLDSMNAYIIKDPERNLIIDTGMSQTPCEKVMRDALVELKIDLDRTDFFMTHHHGDHFGLVGRLLSDTSIIYINRLEADLIGRIASRTILTEIAGFVEITGFPEKDLSKIIPERAGMEYLARNAWPFSFVKDGDIITCGGHHFTCVHTPGHSSGHMCLYDQDNDIFVSGDHLLKNITPAIQLRSDEENPLEAYERSLERLAALEVSLVLPGHGATFKNYQERINQMKSHHHQRAQETISALNQGSKDAYEVAALIPWSIIDFEGWEAVPLLQKFFATGEAFSHLKYLEGKGKVKKEIRDRRLVYSPVP